MTTATDARTSTATKASDASPTARDDVFYELLLTLTAGGIALDADGIKVFRDVVDRTVGDFLVNTMRKEGKDLWKSKKFQDWTKRNTRLIAQAALDMGGNQPSASVVRSAANDVIRHAHDDYCASLPRSNERGPVCSGYLLTQEGK